MKLIRYIHRSLTVRERSIMHRIKRIACLIGISLGMCGCCSIYHGWGVVNNTDYILMVHQDGKLIATMPPGTVTKLKQQFWTGEFSLVTVTAYNTGSDYRGANSYTFSKFVPYNWQINHVHKAEGTL